jgi:hypothetical protein
VSPTPPHFQALEVIEDRGIPGLLEVLREEGLEDFSFIDSAITALKENLNQRR